MPKASIDLHYGFEFWENNIRSPREMGCMKTVSETSPVEGRSHTDLDRGVLPSYGSHNFASLDWAQEIHSFRLLREAGGT